MILNPPARLLALWQQEPLGASWAEQSRSSCYMNDLHRTVWYELQARDWPFKNQAAEALIWQIGSGEGVKRVLASISLGKEVTVSSHLFLEREEGLKGGAWAWLSFIHLPEKWDLKTDGSQADLFAAGCKNEKRLEGNKGNGFN